ncbi:YdjY domain-containing protein [Schlesneria sp. DSM 10557]|uniref:YdjY domain-containing protein n=1 Tax=Schlesneria sp. DSM 10557 TaxID=3044399 RepID=UPI0035A17282
MSQSHPFLIALLAVSLLPASLLAADPPANAVDQATADFKPLNKQGTVLLDAKGKRLLLKSEVVLREGLLELLCCLKRSKEHESILAVETQAQYVHAGLLALGAQAGSPVRWEPDYQPASGPVIDVFLTWNDEDGKVHREPAQSWVRHATRRYFVEKLDSPPKDFKLPADSELKWDPRNGELLWYGTMSEEQRDAALKISKDPAFQKAIRSFFKLTQVRQMDAKWVFAGSYFVTDEKTGEKFYQAEAGDLICVANFATATLDLSVNSSATNDDLMFEAYTERIPPVGTKVTIELIPDFKSVGKQKKVKE